MSRLWQIGQHLGEIEIRQGLQVRLGGLRLFRGPERGRQGRYGRGEFGVQGGLSEGKTPWRRR
jgi:hypothetical protein